MAEARRRSPRLSRPSRRRTGRDLPIGGVEQAANEWRTEASKEIEAVREGNPQLADALVKVGIAKSRFDTVRERLDQLDAAISSRLDQIRTSVDDGPGRHCAGVHADRAGWRSS